MIRDLKRRVRARERERPSEIKNMLLKSKIQVAIKETNSKVVYVKLKELFKKIYKLNETIDDSSLLNDMYAQIDNNNLVSDDKFKLYYLPASKNESSFTQMSNFDDYNKFINKSIMTVATKGKLFLLDMFYSSIPNLT